MNSGFGKRFVSLLACLVFVAGLVVLMPRKGKAIPAFSRQYGTSCSTCHVDFPKLNDFGKAFKDAGFKFPKDDESYVKVQPVMLGAPASKELFPKSIWPGTIPGIPQIGFRMNNFFQVMGRSANSFNVVNALNASNGIPQYIPRTDFETGYFSLFSAGNFGSEIAFWVDDDISVAGLNSNGALGDAYLKFVDIGRFLKFPKDSLSLRAGQFELDLPFTQARTYNISGYDIYQEANIGAMNSMFSQQNVNNNFSFANAAQGIELSGGHSYGGYHYSLAVVNQNTSGVDQGSNTSPYVPSATGSSNGGVGFASDANFKDLYGRLAYRFNLERDAASRNDVQAAGAMGPRDHTSLRFGTFYFYGRSVQRLLGATSAAPTVVSTLLTAREPFYRVGGDISFNYRQFNVYGLYMYGHDHNLLPIDASGALIPLGNGTPLPVGFARGTAATFDGGFIQADYLALPWMMTMMRWDVVNSSADRINGLSGSTSGPFNAPFSSTRNRFSPGVQFLIHANIKASFEYEIRPPQAVLIVTNPSTGLPMATNPFRTNAATVALEFVY